MYCNFYKSSTSPVKHGLRDVSLGDNVGLTEISFANYLVLNQNYCSKSLLHKLMIYTIHFKSNVVNYELSSPHSIKFYFVSLYSVLSRLHAEPEQSLPLTVDPV